MAKVDQLEFELTRCTASDLARRIAAGELSAREVVEASICRMEQVNGRLNAVVVQLFDQARREASEADTSRARGQALGPLHGVPITIKEMFDVQGTATTVGLTTRTGHRATADAESVARLRRAGAIVLGKTNVPQLGLMVETDNPVYGRTNNPWDLERSPGGSSGGEGAIIAAGGAPLGLGSDAGGSIRIPCHVCGIHGLKPTGRRLSLLGHWALPNWPPEWAQAGPMARSVDDLWLAMQVLTRPRGPVTELDTLPGELSDPARVSVEKLRIGVYTDLELIAAAPAVRRAVEEAAEALRQRGAAVEPFTPPDLEQAWEIYLGLLSADGFGHLKRLAKGSEVDWRIKQFVRLATAPTFARSVMRLALKRFGQHYMGEPLRYVPKSAVSAFDYFKLRQRQFAYRQRFVQAMDGGRLDAILCPPSPLPAVSHGCFLPSFGLVYTALYNLLAMPAGVVAATRVRAGEESDRPASKDAVQRAFRHIESGSAGLPIGVQVVARWWREDVALAVMRTLEQHFRTQKDYPAFPPI